jgi:GntR family transcriptional regulator
MQRLESGKLAARVHAEILQAIVRKEFTEKLPSEEVLAETLNVSRTTIRSALQSLEEVGIVTRTRAIGTTINPHVRASALALQRLVAFDDLLREKGYEVEVDTAWSFGFPDADFARHFPQFHETTECLLTDKRYRADGHVAIWIRDAIPREQLRSERFKEPMPASLFEFSHLYGRREIAHAVVEIAAMVKRDEDTTPVETAVGEPFMQLHETHFDSRREPVAYSIIDVDNAFVTFEVFRRS